MSLPEKRIEYPEIKNQLDRIEANVNKIIETIHGNGKPGLKTDVAMNTEFRKGIKKLLLSLFVPLYAGLVTLLLKLLM